MNAKAAATAIARHCIEKHCQVCAVLYEFTAVHFSPVPGGYRTCAWAGHTESSSDWWAASSGRATEPVNG